MLGITPEAQRESDVLAADPPGRAHHVGTAEIRAFQKSYTDEIEAVDLVVFSAPQLSLLELQQVAVLLEGRRATIPLLVVTSPPVKADADRLGLSSRIEAAGGIVLSGMCFYQSYARGMAESNGWRRLATNSAKLTNIIGGYGYKPALLSMEACIAAACDGGSIVR
jgi:predicted aconitase